MSPWWVLVAVVLVGGTAVVARRVAGVLGAVGVALDPEHGLTAASAPLPGMADDAVLAHHRLTDLGVVVRRRRRLLRMAHPGRPWAELRQRAGDPRRHGSGRSSS